MKNYSLISTVLQTKIYIMRAGRHFVDFIIINCQLFSIDPMRGYKVLSIKPMWGIHARCCYVIEGLFRVPGYGKPPGWSSWKLGGWDI